MVACLMLLACNKQEQSSADPESGSNLLGGENAGHTPRERSGEAVPVKCINDPSDPDCAEVLGVEQSDDGGLEFGDACRKNLCHGNGDCTLDPEGAVTCECDEGSSGPECQKRGG